MKCGIICLMSLCAFEIVFADLNSDFLMEIKKISIAAQNDVNERAAVASGKNIKFANCKDLATNALQSAVFQRQQQGQTCIDDKKQKDKTACSRKAISDLRKDLKPIGPNEQACIDKCAKTKNCYDD